MATKKEIKIAKAKAKAIDGGFTPSVADNVFAMQMGSKEMDTPTTFSTRDQGVMAMSTMYQTKDPNGTLDLSTSDQNVTFIEQDDIEIQRPDDSYDGSGGYMDPAAWEKWYNSPAGAEYRSKYTITGKGKTFTDTIQTEVTDTLPGEKYQATLGGDFAQGFDSVGSTDKKKTGGGPAKSDGSGGDGMIDTFTSYDTRQARRKGIVEGRGIQQAARDVKQQQRKTDRLGRKDEMQAFKSGKKEARKALREARRNNRTAASATRKARRANPNISGSNEFGLKSGMVSSNRAVTDAKARLKEAKSSKPLTAAEQRRSRKKTFQDTKTAQSQKQLQKARDIEAQGELQRKAMKNPRTTKEFAMPMLVNKKMSFRK